MGIEGRRPPPAIPTGLEPNLNRIYHYLHHQYRAQTVAQPHGDTHLPGGGDELPFPFGSPVNIGMTNSPGTSEQFIRADHVHATPLTMNGDLLTVVGGGLARLGVEANPDGYVLTKVAGLPAWAAPTGGGGSYTDEQAVDAVATAIIDSGRINWTYDDAANQLSGDIFNYSISNQQLRYGAATSVVGRAAGTSGELADIPATSDGQFLGRVGGVLTWAVPSGAEGINELTGDVTAGPGTGAQAATIANDAVSYAKMQNVSTVSRLLGRGSAAGAGDPEEIIIGAGLTMTGTTLSSTGGYDNEQAVDAVAAALVNSSRIQWTYNDSLNQISADVFDHSIGDDQLRYGGATSVVGRATGSSGPLADIAATADGQFLGRVGGVLAWAVPAGGGSGITELTGEVTAGPGSGSQAATIQPHDIITKHNGFPGGGTTFLRDDATWATPPGGGGGVTDGDKGHIVVSGGGMVWNLDPTAEPTLAGLTLGTEEFATQAITPAAITAQQNNYAPGNGSFFRISGTGGAWAITGFTGGVNGRRILLRNVGAQNIRLADQNASSLDANRIITPTGADILMLPDQTASLIYDATTLKWVVETPAQHSLLGGHSDTTPATSARGDIIVAGFGTGFPFARKAIGAAATVLRSDGLDPAWSKVALTTDVSGMLPIANGGTGQASAPNAFNALSPITALGDLIYGSGVNTATKLAGNTTTTKKYLAMTGTGSVAAAPVWDTAPPAGAPVDAAYVTIGANATLTGERALTGTANQVIVTDGGAGGAVTLSLPQNIHAAAEPTFAGLTLTNKDWNTQSATTGGLASGAVNDLAIGNGVHFRLAHSGGTTITGIAGGINGRRILLSNVNALYSITFAHQDAGSTAANRFSLAGNRPLTLAGGGGVEFIYDATAQRWMMADIPPDDDAWLTLPTFTGNVVDYDVGLGASFRIDLTGNFNVSGFANGWDGRRLRLRNVSAYTWQLRHQAATSLPQNRIIGPGPAAGPVGSRHLYIGPDEVAALTYDGTTQRWIAARSGLPIVVDNLNNVLLNASGLVLPTTATDGFILLPICAGVPTGTPSPNVAAVAGFQVPVVIDSTNFRLYAYLSGAWRQL